MTKIRKDDDVAQHVPKPEGTEDKAASKSGKQDGPNYRDTTDGGRAVPVDNMNSANDE